MKLARRGIAVALTAAAAVGSIGSDAAAQGEYEGPARSPSAEPPAEVVGYVKRTPNVDMIAGGLFVFGLGYGGAVIGAARSEVRADDRLYAPFVGPWMDLANRPGCGPGPSRPACELEGTYQALLVTSGVLQAVGGLAVLGGLAFPKTEIVTTRPGVRVVPTAGRSGVGVTAVGTF